ncbi:MAG: PilZ domain-containing protein [Desulfobulbaceae bacterium]|nr:PilZ domain-containing protein [Desulfobulbaceae bacterium]
MSTSFSMNNRRRFPRFKPKDEIYVVDSNFGKVVDISMGGILFCYQGNYNGNEPLSTNDILFGCQNSQIEKIPFLTISDISLGELPSKDAYNRLRRVIFDNLTSDQIAQLEHFMLENVHIPQLET